MSLLFPWYLIMNIFKLIKPIRVSPKFAEVFWVTLVIREHGRALSQAGQDCAEGLPEQRYTVHIHFEVGVKGFSTAHAKAPVQN